MNRRFSILCCVCGALTLAACFAHTPPPDLSSASSQPSQSSAAESSRPVQPLPDFDRTFSESSSETIDPYNNTASLSAEPPSSPSAANPPASSSSQESSQSQASDSPAASSPPSPTEALDAEAIENELLALINRERAANGIETLSMESSMQWAARMRAPEVMSSLSHTRTDGTPYYTAFDEAGFPYAGRWHGENVSYMQFPAGSYSSAEAALKMFEGLRESSGHYQNMLSGNFQLAGIGAHILRKDNAVFLYSAQLFASA